MKPRTIFSRRFRVRIRRGGWIRIPSPVLQTFAAGVAQLVVESRKDCLILYRGKSQADLRTDMSRSRFAHISNVRNAAVDAMRQFMNEASAASVGVDVKKLIEEGRD